MDFFELIGPRSTLLERDIQKLYQTYPYLLDPKFLEAHVTPQYPLPSGYADLAIFQPEEITIVELKIDPLGPQYILQLNGYLSDMAEKFPAAGISGILIGQAPKTNMAQLLANLGYPIKIKILEEEVPVKIKICRNCRRANDYRKGWCDYCSCVRWL